MMMLELVTAQAPGAQRSYFCARLAMPLGMKRQSAAAQGYQLNTLGGLGPKLFGGSSTMSISAQPVGHADDAETARLTAMCKIVPKGAVCDVIGPAELHVATAEKVVKVEAATGERAEVRITGSRIRCEDR